MKLRRELCPVKMNKANIKELEDLVGQIEQALELDPKRAEQLIATFNERTRREYTAFEFQHYSAAVDLEEFVAEAAQPTRPVRIPDITREELDEIVRRFTPSENMLEGISGSGEVELMANMSFYQQLFDAQFDMPSASNLLYHPPDDWEGDVAEWNPTPAQIIEIASS